ncbi:MAG: M23 family metallopeptidase [Alphaproteobacteria bacterium]|nr:M23 family metallopeptidase [Alphaproteobacteria bacterium]MBQ8256113.1 M23 family metallopeptidase [Alphaproteobacteria bacterium]
MRRKGIFFTFLLVYIIPNIFDWTVVGATKSFLTAQKYPSGFNDLSFVERMEVLADGYDDVAAEFDENGVCISGCAYVGITLEEEEAYMERAAREFGEIVKRNEAIMAQQQQQLQQQQQAMAQQQMFSGLPAGSMVVQMVNGQPVAYGQVPGQPVAGQITGQQAPAAQTTTGTVAPETQQTASVQPTTLQPVASGGSCSEKNPDIAQGSLFTSPVAGRTQVISDFGERRPPSTRGGKGKGSRYHKGLDITAGTGTKIYAAADGVVSQSSYSGGYGNIVKIEHTLSGTNKKATTAYAHLSKRLVNVGDRVSKGCLIGLAGNTGNSNGSHLHYELYYDGIKVDPLGSYVSPILGSASANAAAAVTQGTNYLGRAYCIRSGLSSVRLRPYAGNSKALKEKFPGCSGWC